MDPEDTRILDDVVRFIGQKVAAVVADSEAIAEEASRRIDVVYDILPAVFDPAAGDRAGRAGHSPRQDAGAPRRQRGTQRRRRDPRRIRRCRGSARDVRRHL